MTNEKAKLIRVLKSNKALFRGADVSATQFLRLVDALLDSGVTVRDYSEKNEPVDGNAIREQETKVVEIDQVRPLTLDELREMDGEPVFVIQPADGPLCLLPSFWGIVNVEEETVSGNLYCATFEDYDTEWLAYRHKP